jgi:hypothetical protein
LKPAALAARHDAFPMKKPPQIASRGFLSLPCKWKADISTSIHSQRRSMSVQGKAQTR